MCHTYSYVWWKHPFREIDIQKILSKTFTVVVFELMGNQPDFPWKKTHPISRWKKIHSALGLPTLKVWEILPDIVNQLVPEDLTHKTVPVNPPKKEGGQLGSRLYVNVDINVSYMCRYIYICMYVLYVHKHHTRRWRPNKSITALEPTLLGKGSETSTWWTHLKKRWV